MFEKKCACESRWFVVFAAAAIWRTFQAQTAARVAIDALFAKLEDGLSIDQFLEEFEGVTRGQAIAFLEFARAALLAGAVQHEASAA